MSNKLATAHIIAHTHWDREWFLTSIYTSRWIPGLIEQIERLVAENPTFSFLFDGQTLVIEDLLAFAPEYRERVETLIRNRNLIIGPYYCQPDWQVTSGEALIRNLQLGAEDVRQYGGESDTGWLVDTFGHVSQSPQLHRMFDINAVFVWRGVPEMEPYFNWRSPNNEDVFAINLFGGYRNLYGITHAPELAEERLRSELLKLAPYYPTPDVPLFDGYDLEDAPEDPVTFYQRQGVVPADDLCIKPASPHSFAHDMQELLTEKPVIAGELNSGRYGAIFPGTLAARTYLKVLARDTEYLLYQVCEPLAALAQQKGRPYNAAQYEAWSRTLLQNAVHDCICGVSIDQVHEKMEYLYRQVYAGMGADIQVSLPYVLRDMASGRYAVSTTGFAYDGHQVVGDQCYRVQTDGVGVWPLGDPAPVESGEAPVSDFVWENDHYTATIDPDGAVRVGDALLGTLQVSEDVGDTYSDEPGVYKQPVLAAAPPVIEQRSDLHCVVRYACDVQVGQMAMQAAVRLTFDHTPLIRWQVDLDSQGTDFKIEMVFKLAQTGQIQAGMPFDIVAREAKDTHLMPRELDAELAGVLLGQREVDVVNTFPFQDYIMVSGPSGTAAVFAQGLHAYQADEQGTFSVTLRRGVDWLTKPDLQLRSGDAGPFFYVPDARCERLVRHELAVAIGDFDAHGPILQQLNAGFQTPPLVVEVEGDGQATEWAFLQERIPMSSLQVRAGKLLARFYNPTKNDWPLARTYTRTDVWGNAVEDAAVVAPGQITTVALEPAAEAQPGTPAGVQVTLLGTLPERVGLNQGVPDPEIIEQLRARIDETASQLREVEAKLTGVNGDQRYRLDHRRYVLERELYEYQLSAHLNALKLAQQGTLDEAYLFDVDEKTAEIGFKLNQLRIKRRIYDYIVQLK